MRILLPENIGDIKLSQFQQFNNLLEKDLEDEELKKHIISIFTELELEQVSNVSQKDIESMYLQITTAINQDSEFTNTFKMDGVEYGFIPNLDLLTGAEWVDLSKYQTDIDNYHRLIAILFRPITKRDKFNNYSIEEYKGTSEYAEKMLNTPMNVINGALVFFYSLANELEISTQKFIAQARVKAHKHQTILRSGDGMQQSLI